MVYYVSGPYSDPYIVDAKSEQDALDICCNYEWMTYDNWAVSGFIGDTDEYYEDYFACENDFEIISEEEFNKEPFYHDLINYDNDWSKCCQIIENKNYIEL